MIGADAKLLAVYNKLEAQIQSLKLRHGSDGAKGADGISIKGDQGDRGADGTSIKGDKGNRGADGTDGTDGIDGISITSAEVDFDNHLVIKFSDGTETDAGEIAGGSGGDQYFRSGSSVNINPSTPKGTSVLDFGSGSNSISLVVEDPNIKSTHQVSVELSSVATAQHPVDDLLVDPIRVIAYNILDGVGFTIYGQMDNAEAHGSYNINWYTR
jgi:hypothetical protein